MPVYTGPTPADPFGGQALDIFDILERAEQGEPAPRPAPAATDLEIPPVPAEATAPADIVAEPVAPEVVADAAPAEAAEPVVAAAPPAPEPEPVPVAVPAAAPEPPAAAEPVIGPVVQPIVVSADSVPATERKRGWWRR